MSVIDSVSSTSYSGASKSTNGTSGNGNAFAENFDFSEDMYSDPAMRPYLEQYYQKAYAPMRERIAAMREGDYEPVTFTDSNGNVATELSADQYERMIPSFDKWLEVQQQFSPFDFEQQQAAMLEHAKQSVATLEARSPDSQSDVRVVFANGDQILGYMDSAGGVASHSGGHALQNIVQKGNDMGLRGQAREDYITREGTKALSGQYPNLTVNHYSDETAPTRREFSQKWYPDHDVDANYASALSDARDNLTKQQSHYDRMQANMRDMKSFLLGLMEQQPAA
ncbi:hypothetical protein TH25_08965 [Thalassospira profundimaris]|uniref:Uncharacterized protein n=1 Tax=Thalassospira profundimaris TaxID=502049 RepID=A0A367XEB7_9PROT|nr:hypothetical protein [Thalassospira profundimaris]RCK51779.1 hypothetical protein TH25_08965 [Thalassospira profundimaris]